MNFNQIVEALPKTTFGKDDIITAASETRQPIQSGSVFWLINCLIDSGMIQRTGRNRYVVDGGARKRSAYHYTFSEPLQRIVSSIEEQYPLVEFQAWEAFQYNRFVNHLIAHNMFFIDVEGMLCDTVFEFLRDSGQGTVLKNPKEADFLTYAVHDCIIVQNLITEAPKDSANPHTVVIEKFLVDMLADKKVSLFVEPAAFPAIWEEAFSSYIIDESRLLRYAQRRHAKEKVLSLIHDHTDIRLNMEETA